MKRFLSHLTEASGVIGSFDLGRMESQDRQLKFQGVRFEARTVKLGHVHEDKMRPDTYLA